MSDGPIIRRTTMPETPEEIEALREHIGVPVVNGQDPTLEQYALTVVDASERYGAPDHPHIAGSRAGSAPDGDARYRALDYPHIAGS